MRIDLCSYGSREVPQYAIGQLEKQESQWSNPLQVWRPENQGSQWRNSQSKSKGLRTKAPMSEGRRKQIFQL